MRKGSPTNLHHAYRIGRHALSESTDCVTPGSLTCRPKVRGLANDLMWASSKTAFAAGVFPRKPTTQKELLQTAGLVRDTAFYKGDSQEKKAGSSGNLGRAIQPPLCWEESLANPTVTARENLQGWSGLDRRPSS